MGAAAAAGAHCPGRDHIAFKRNDPRRASHVRRRMSVVHGDVDTRDGHASRVRQPERAFDTHFGGSAVEHAEVTVTHIIVFALRLAVASGKHPVSSVCLDHGQEADHEHGERTNENRHINSPIDD